MELTRTVSKPVEAVDKADNPVVNAILTGLVSAAVYEAFRRDTPVHINPNIVIEVQDAQG